MSCRDQRRLAFACLPVLLCASVGSSCEAGTGMMSEGGTAPAALSTSADALTNPFLADSPWPMAHRESGAPDSTPYPGPEGSRALGQPQFVPTGLLNITLAISPAYPDGRRAIWGSNLSDVYKLTVSDGELRMLARIAKPGSALSSLASPTSGAYTLVDRDNTFFTVRGTKLLAYRDREPGALEGPIELWRELTLPANQVSEDDALVGLNLLWDGNLAFVTQTGVVGVVDRALTDVRTLRLGGGDESVSNSLATDERGGIYVVTSRQLCRVQWTSGQLSLVEADGAWCAPYLAGSGAAGGGSLGAGSGSTPTLMGSGDQRFVVITDGAKLANLVLFWADTIPSDWQPIAPEVSRRIAAQRAIDFGDPARTQTTSQQSVAVSGYGAYVVSNDYRNTDNLHASSGNPVIDSLSNAGVELLSGTTAVQPWGVQKFVWDPAARSLASAWARLDVSCPNAIPVISDASRRFYCVGAHAGRWTIESLDVDRGERHERTYLGSGAHYNSFYAATELPGDGSVLYGSYDGVVYIPARER